jgi:hypothetical protein
LVDGEVFDVKRVGIRIGRVAQSNEVGGLWVIQIICVDYWEAIFFGINVWGNEDSAWWILLKRNCNEIPYFRLDESIRTNHALRKYANLQSVSIQNLMRNMLNANYIYQQIISRIIKSVKRYYIDIHQRLRPPVIHHVIAERKLSWWL